MSKMLERAAKAYARAPDHERDVFDDGIPHDCDRMRAALLAALDPEDREARRAMGCAMWTEMYGDRYGAPTDPMKCDPHGCSPTKHEAHIKYEQWEELDDQVRAAIAALRATAQGGPSSP